MSAVQRHEHRLVVLVSVTVDHDEDPAEAGEDDEGMAPDELGVLQGDVGRQERLGHAPAVVHGVEAHLPRQVAHEQEPVAAVWGTKQPRGQQ